MRFGRLLCDGVFFPFTFMLLAQLLPRELLKFATKIHLVCVQEYVIKNFFILALLQHEATFSAVV